MAPVINCIVVVSQNMGIGKNGDLPWPMNEPGHQRLFVTRILREFESDMFFPETDLKRYKLLPEYPGVLTDVQEEKGIQHKCEVHEKHD